MLLTVKTWARRVAPTITGLLALTSLTGIADAMRVSPMVVEMTSKGTGSTARVEVQNINQVNLPFETRITRIDYDAQGKMTEVPADADFLVFPPQGLLVPGGRQVVRLQWAGPADLPSSRGYYVSVNQLPVPLAPGEGASPGAQVQVIYHMKALVVVAPPGASPKVEVVSARPVMIDAAPAPVTAGATTPASAPGSGPAPVAAVPGAAIPGVEVTVRNTGARYAMMAGPNWIIDGKGTDGKPLSVMVTSSDLNRSIGIGYLAALNGQRTFQVPTGTAFAPGAIKIRFSK